MDEAAATSSTSRQVDNAPARHSNESVHEGDRLASSADPPPHVTADRAENETPPAGASEGNSAGGPAPTSEAAATVPGRSAAQVPVPAAGASLREPAPEGGGGAVADEAPSRPAVPLP